MGDARSLRTGGKRAALASRSGASSPHPPNPSPVSSLRKTFALPRQVTGVELERAGAGEKGGWGYPSAGLPSSAPWPAGAAVRYAYGTSADGRVSNL